jgi:hypothetical protein
MELDIQVGRNANASSFIQSIATHGHSSLTGPLLSLIIEEWTGSWAWWLTLVILAGGSKFEASLSYIVNSRLSWAT